LNLLIIEDEGPIADFLRRGLSAEGYFVTRAEDGETGLELHALHGFDLILLDVMLPGISGYEVCARLRAGGDRTPVLMLTAMGGVDERVQGLRIGADDYLSKPFAFDELLARLEALSRRTRTTGDGAMQEVLVCGEIEYRPSARQVTVNGLAITLTRRERNVLHLFLTKRDSLVSRERLLNSVWGVNEDPQVNVVDVHIARLRKKLGPAGRRLRTVRGEGYILGCAEPAQITPGGS